MLESDKDYDGNPDIVDHGSNICGTEGMDPVTSILGAVAVMLAILSLILVVCFVHERRKRLKEARWKKVNEKFNTPKIFSQPQSYKFQQEATFHNPQEHVYEEVDDYTVSNHSPKWQNNITVGEVYESANSLYGVSLN